MTKSVDPTNEMTQAEEAKAKLTELNDEQLDQVAGGRKKAAAAAPAAPAPCM